MQTADGAATTSEIQPELVDAITDFEEDDYGDETCLDKEGCVDKPKYDHMKDLFVDEIAMELMRIKPLMLAFFGVPPVDLAMSVGLKIKYGND